MTRPKLAAPVLERGRITRIAMRAEREGIITGAEVASTRMDLTATHLNGCPLDLARMLTCGRDELAHDVRGIARHLDRETGRLGGCFLPKGALPEGGEQVW